MDIITKYNGLQFTLPPVQPWLQPEFERAGIQVDVLRLDAMHPMIGGNKWMKLRGFLEKAWAEKKTGIITNGGPWSNHIHACAWLCRQYGLHCHIRVKGNSQMQTAMLEDAVKWNAIIEFVNRTAFYDEEAALQFANDNNLLYIPMGGADNVGVEYVTKFLQQLPLPVYDHAICGVGTATTLGGLVAVPGNFTDTIGIDAGTSDNGVQEKMMQWRQTFPNKTLSLISDYDFGGFARHTPLLIQFMNKLYNNHQIPTDIVYTGKVFYAVLNMAISYYFPAGAKLLVVHSGGLQGNRSLRPGTLQY